MISSIEYSGEYIDGYPPGDHILARYERAFPESNDDNGMTETEYIQLQQKIAIVCLLGSIRKSVIPYVTQRADDRKQKMNHQAVQKSKNTKKLMATVHESYELFQAYSTHQLYYILYMMDIQLKGAIKKQKKNIEEISILLRSILDERGYHAHKTREEIIQGYADISDTDMKRIRDLGKLL